jgi:protein tyrosine phosphatase
VRNSICVVSYTEWKNDIEIWERLIVITDGKSKRELKLIQMDQWKDDASVNEEKLVQLDYLIKETKCAAGAHRPPVLIHCSAGVGRTGTLIALLQLIETVEF